MTLCGQGKEKEGREEVRKKEGGGRRGKGEEKESKRRYTAKKGSWKVSCN